MGNKSEEYEKLKNDVELAFVLYFLALREVPKPQRVADIESILEDSLSHWRCFRNELEKKST
jgi:hypothetical protein